MKERTISGAIIVAITIIALYFGGLLFELFVGLLSVFSFYELMKVKKDGRTPNIMKIVGLICMLLLIFINSKERYVIFGLSYETLSLLFILILLPTVLLKKVKYTTSDAFYLGSITIFLGTVFNLCLTLYNESISSFILVIIIAFATDTFAYLGGKLIGKHKITQISPNKTLEGSIIGTLICTIISTTYYVVFISPVNMVRTVIILMILSIIGQLGDLFFSLIKRENDAKDFSRLIPGHGGILDRIDSIIFILIAFVFMMQFL